MSYIRAEEVLPKELIETIQQYVNGKAIYIPSTSKKEWGNIIMPRWFLMKRLENFILRLHKNMEL